ncbi:hypothetical protein pb186bvf_020718 [Paramecium bursaria]
MIYLQVKGDSQSYTMKHYYCNCIIKECSVIWFIIFCKLCAQKITIKTYEVFQSPRDIYQPQKLESEMSLQVLRSTF